MISKKSLLIGIGIFVICFVSINITGSLSLPKTYNELYIEKYHPPFPPIVGADSVRIRDDLVFFWPLVFTKGYNKGDGSYRWLFGYPPPTKHPFVLLYWAFVSATISLLVMRILSKRRIKRDSFNEAS